MRRNPGGIDAVKLALEQLFQKIGPKLAEELKTAYRQYALSQFNYLMEAAKEPQQEELGEYRHWSRGYHHYLGINKAVVDRSKDSYELSHRTSWKTLRDHPDAYRVEYANADREAAAALENARHSFISKNVVKFENVLGKRTDVENILFDVKWSRGVFEGHITVTLSDAIIVASVGLKYVLRTVPKLTPYYQYPLLFRSVVDLDGKKYLAPSESELRTLLGAPPPPTAEEVRAAKGLCPASGTYLPREKWAPISSRMSPYTNCPVCGQGVSAQGGKYRAHKTPEAARSGLLAKGYCELSDTKIPPEIVEAAIAEAVKKMPDYEGIYRRDPFDSYSVRFKCPSCGWKGGATRKGEFKLHKRRNP